MSLFTPNKTSAKLLIDYAEAMWQPTEPSSEHKTRYLLLYDLYIKARSYAIINKVAFWFAVITGIMVLIWPSLATVCANCEACKNSGLNNIEFFKSAIVQTTITGLAALAFAIYAHYKKRQMYMENLMRYLVYSDESGDKLIQKVLAEMEKLDTGFSFAEVIPKNQKPRT